MNELIGKVKTEYKNILSQNDNILKSLDFSKIEVVDFNPSHKLDEDQLFQIQQFSTKEFYIEQCGNSYSTASLTQIKNDEYDKISSLCILQDNERHFQRITPSLYVNKKTLLDYSGAPKIVKQNKQIEIKNESDAIYLIDKDTLFFKNLSIIKVIFPGIEQLHRIATQKEVDTFLTHKFIKLEDFEPKIVGTQNRKRIGDIGKKFEKLNKEKKEKLIKYAKEKSGIELKKDAFLITSDIDLKNLLYAIDQRYYYADIYEEERIASSIRPNPNINKKK